MPTQPDWKACLIISGIVVLAGCGQYHRANDARAEEIRKLSHETYAQAARADDPDDPDDPDRCSDVSCAREEAGFAYAKRNRVENPDNCAGKGDDDFVRGCRQYGEDVEAAYQRFAHEG